MYTNLATKHNSIALYNDEEPSSPNELQVDSFSDLDDFEIESTLTPIFSKSEVTFDDKRFSCPAGVA